MKISALCSKMESLSAVGSSRSTYLKGERTVSAPRLVASNTPAALGAGRSRGRTPLKIVAARVAGVEIPNAKNLEVRLPVSIHRGEKLEPDSDSDSLSLSLSLHFRTPR